MSWVTGDHPTKQELAACVECGLCLPHCPTFRLTGDETASPRGRLAAMSAVAAGEAAVDDTFAELMGFCLQCRACEAACPSSVPYGRAMEGARAEIAAQLDSPLRKARRAITGSALASRSAVRVASTGAALAQKLRLDDVVPPLRKRMGGMREIPLPPPSTIGRQWRPAPGMGIRGHVGLLAGCVMDPWFGPVHEATGMILAAAGYVVVVPETQTCCGALAAHEGAAEATRHMAKANIDAFARFDYVVADAAGCSAHLKDYVHWGAGGDELASRVRDVTELVAAAIDEGVLPEFPSHGTEVAVQDPCHLRHVQRVTAAPRTIVRAAGYVPVDVDEVGMCCGAAGFYSLIHPETSAELGSRKAGEVRETGAAIVASANPGCEMQLRLHLGRSTRVAHPVELYYEAMLARAR
jgi:glycolate oxidase iron-sulfur subunit